MSLPMAPRSVCSSTLDRHTRDVRQQKGNLNSKQHPQFPHRPQLLTRFPPVPHQSLVGGAYGNSQVPRQLWERRTRRSWSEHTTNRRRPHQKTCLLQTPPHPSCCISPVLTKLQLQVHTGTRSTTLCIVKRVRVSAQGVLLVRLSGAPAESARTSPPSWPATILCSQSSARGRHCCKPNTKEVSKTRKSRD